MGTIRPYKDRSLLEVAICTADLDTGISTDDVENVAAPEDTVVTHFRNQDLTKLCPLNNVGVESVPSKRIERMKRE